MYVETDEAIFVYKQVDVLLRHMTLLTAFRIAAICQEVNIVVDQATADNAHGRVDSKHSTLYRQNTSSGL